MFNNNRTLDWKVSLLKIILSDDKLEQHMEIINGKYEDKDFAMNSMKQMSKIFSRFCDNKKKSKKVI